MTMTLPATSEQLFRPPDIEDAELVEEVAPTVTEEPVATRVYKALEKGTCPVCGMEMTAARLGIHMRAKHPDTDEAPEQPAEPVTAKGSLKSWLGPKKEKAPKVKLPTGKRVKADEILTTAVVGIAGLLVNSGISSPTGQALMLEATLLGPEFDKAVAGSMVDRVAIQPLVRAKGRWEGVASLAAFPVIVFALDRKPDMLPVLYPALRSSMKTILPGLVQAKKRQVADEEKLRDAARELMDLDLELQTMAENAGPDPIDLLIQSLFASKVAAQQGNDDAPAE